VIRCTAAIAFPLKSSRILSGSICVFLSACGWSKTCWRHEGLLSRIKRSGFGQRNSAGRLGDKWHLDEVVVSIRGKKHWLWRAVDQDGFVLDVLVQSRRNAKAAKRLMRKLLKSQARAPRVMITDKLRSYDAAKREIMPSVEHRSHKGLNNRAENSHQPIRRRERIMKRFKSQRHLQRFVSIHDPIANLFHIPATTSHPAIIETCVQRQ
jgi:putative transposase